MGHAETKGQLMVALLTPAIFLACGGVTVEPSPSSGGASNGGSGAAAGRPGAGGTGGALPDCKNPLAHGTPCGTPGAHCGGPCSNSWQADNTCEDGVWNLSRVVPCGPDASHAPRCRNSFSG